MRPDTEAASVVYVVTNTTAGEPLGVHADRAAAIDAAERWCAAPGRVGDVVTITGWDPRAGRQGVYYWARRWKAGIRRWSPPTIYDPEVTP